MKAENIDPPKDPVAFVKSVARLTHQNRSSMAQDIYFKRRTEIDFINGFLIKQAKINQIKTPNLEFWYSAVTRKSTNYE